MTGGRRSGDLEALLAFSAEELPTPRADVSTLDTAELKRMCDAYFTLLDQLDPPECLLADYESACDELVRRRTMATSPTPL
jgi:hypothetical protein